jgi:hypothetical protein
MLPAIIRAFTASDNMAIAEPATRKDEKWAEQATTGLNYTFYKANDGYQVLYDTTYDSLLHGDGYVKHFFDDTPVTKVSFHSGLSDDELTALLEPEDDGTDEDGEPLEEIEILDQKTEEYELEPGDEGYEDYGMAGPPPGLGAQPSAAPPAGATAPPGVPPPPVPPTGGNGAMPPPQGAMQPPPPGMEGMPPQPPGPPPVPQQSAPNGAPPMPGAPPMFAPPPMVMPQPRIELRHSVKIKRTCRYGAVKLAAIAPEDMVISDDTIDIRKARMVGCKEQKTRSELIEMGFDKEKVSQLLADTDDDAMKHSRSTDGETPRSLDVATTELELITLYELYLQIDMDDDGIAETVQVFYGGYGSTGQLLEWNLWEDEPVFTNIPSYRIPHRQNADSLFDKTKDIQEVNTVLTRQTLDSLYASTMPQRVAVGRVLNPDELTNPSFGGTVLMEEGGSLNNLVQQFVGDVALKGIEFFNGVVEKRTGVSRQTMALDPEALQNQTATAAQLGHDAGYTQIELITRNQAELGWVYVFRAMLKLMVRHQQRRSTIRLTGKKWVDIDPRHWNADMDITINTGLGTGSRDRDMATLQQMQGNQLGVLQILREAMMPQKALSMVPMILNTARKAAEAAGVKNIEDFYPEVTDQDLMQAAQAMQAAQGQPPPQLMMEMQLEQAKIQAQMQAKQAELQAKLQYDQGKLQLDQQADQLKSEVQVRREQAQLEADLQTKEADRQVNAMIEAKRAELEQLKLAETSRQKDLDRQQQWDLEILKLDTHSELEGAKLGMAMASEGEKEGEKKKPKKPVTDASVALKGLNDVVAQLRDMQMNNGQPAALEGLKEMIAQLTAMHSAPKRVVRDETGRVTGVETVQ